MIISAYMRSGINWCFLHTSPKTASLVTEAQKHVHGSKSKKVKKERKGRLDFKPFILHSLPSFPLFIAPSFLPSQCTSSFLLAPFIPLIEGLHFVEMERIWKCVWLHDPEWGSQREGGREGGSQQGHMKEKMKSDLVDPWIYGQSKGGRGGKIKVQAQWEAGS